MKVAVEDLHRVIDAAKKLGGKVVLGGHSLGGTVVTAYATWDFDGKPGADGLAGLVYIDGGSGLARRAADRGDGDRVAAGTQRADRVAVAHVRRDPRAVRRRVHRERIGGRAARTEPAVARADVRPVAGQHRSAGARRATSGQFGYALNVATSPPEPRRRAGAPRNGCRREGSGARLERRGRAHADRPLRDDVLRHRASKSVDGSEWYFPARLTADTVGGQQRQRESRAVGARRGRDDGPRPAEGSPDLRVRHAASAGSACSTRREGVGRAVGDSRRATSRW